MNLIWNFVYLFTVYWENCNIIIAYIMVPKAYLECYQRSKIESCANIVKGKRLLTTFTKFSILDILQGSEYASGYCLLCLYLFYIFYNSAPWSPRTKLFLLCQACEGIMVITGRTYCVHYCILNKFLHILEWQWTNDH